MSPSSVGVASRSRARRDAAQRAAARRRAATRRRRRRLAFAGLGVGAIAIAVALAMPFLRKEVNELTLPLAYTSVIREQAAAKHIDPALIAGVIYAETKFDPRDSPVGAMGLMQVMPQTAAFLARRSGATTFTTTDLDEPAVNIAYGSYYLRYLLNEYHGNVTVALAAYNGGESNVDRWLAAARAGGHPFTVGDIPFPETRAYVTKVLNAEQDYKSKYSSQLYG
ncbi:MAG TPA: lytic transglycosylase domain-containing protein [Solirubrobacteraceae bacterium]|nr:lytic transglycosylase domain-containing protein [Solirubrobacteraceae bacterium]